MLTIQYTTSLGVFARIEVQQVEFVMNCHYAACGAEFTTIDPDQLYCKTSHSVRACEMRRILRESRLPA
jgi:hypothetical protein